MRRSYWGPLLVCLFIFYAWNLEDDDLDYELIREADDANPHINEFNFQPEFQTQRDPEAAMLNRTLVKVKLDGINPKTRLYGLHEFHLTQNTTTSGYDDRDTGRNNMTDSKYGNFSLDHTTVAQDVNATTTPGSLMKLPPDRDTWQTVEEFQIYVIAAHRDLRHTAGPHIVVLGLMLAPLLRQAGVKLYCHLASSQLGIVDTVLGDLETMAVRRYKYEAFTLGCNFDTGAYVHNDSFVSIATTAWDIPTNALTIHDNIQHNSSKVNFTMCGWDVLHNQTNYQAFIEWMTLNMLLGVERVVLYVVDVDEVLEAVLDSYLEDGVLELVNLGLQHTSIGEGTTGLDVDLMGLYAAFLAPHDCLLRSSGRTRYLTYLNMDEVIVPRYAHLHTLTDLVQMSKCDGRSYLSLLNYFFHPTWPDDEEFSSNQLVHSQLRLMTLQKTLREESFLRFENHSRYLVRPENVVQVRRHKVVLAEEVMEMPCIVHPDVGALHHYDTIHPSTGDDRRKLQDSINKHPLGIIRDRTIHKFAWSLITKTMERHKRLGVLFDD